MTNHARTLAPSEQERKGTTVDKLLLTVAEAAELLGIGRSHAYAFVMKGELPSVKLGKSRRVSAADLDAFVARLRSGEAE
jgi:excisionase family DNA binding protein